MCRMIKAPAPEVEGVSLIKSPENIPIVFLRLVIIILVCIVSLPETLC